MIRTFKTEKNRHRRRRWRQRTTGRINYRKEISLARQCDLSRPLGGLRMGPTQTHPAHASSNCYPNCQIKYSSILFNLLIIW